MKVAKWGNSLAVRLPGAADFIGRNLLATLGATITQDYPRPLLCNLPLS